LIAAAFWRQNGLLFEFSSLEQLDFKEPGALEQWEEVLLSVFKQLGVKEPEQ
jgi:hypothetical protein